MITIFTAALFGVSVLCGGQPTWTTPNGYTVASPAGANGYYVPRDYMGGEVIVISPRNCGHVRSLDRVGRRLLSHELTHWWQEYTGQPFDELDAAEVGHLGARLSQRRWAVY